MKLEAMNPEFFTLGICDSECRNIDLEIRCECGKEDPATGLTPVIVQCKNFEVCLNALMLNDQLKSGKTAEEAQSENSEANPCLYD